MSDILRILQITFGDSEKAIHSAIRKTRVAIRKAVQDGSIAIRCHTESCTVQQESHTVPYKELYKTARKPYSTAQLPYDAIYKAIQYSRKAIQCTYRKPYTKKDNKKKETTKMEKLKRTFRLSEQAVEAIENRNRKLYPTATDFLEAKILAPADNSTEMLHKISAQLREMESLLVQQYHKKIEEEQPFH